VALKISLNDLDLIEQHWIRVARNDFWVYRKLVNPTMTEGWWQKEVAGHLQQFYYDFVAGLRPVLILEAPPQHGKSLQVIDLCTWIAGKDPNLRSIFASYSDRLGTRANLRSQRIYDSEMYQAIFPDTYIKQSRKLGLVDSNYLRNTEIIEFVGNEGSFRNTTVMGGITGESLDIGLMDDATKGRAEARSKTVKLKTIDWLTDDFFTRFSENAGLINIQTRWAVDDVAGFMRDNFPNVKTLSYPAIAIEDEENRDKGEPLFPELKSLEFLMARKKVLSSASWLSLYQANPIIEGGEIIKGKYFPRYDKIPALKYRKIYVDTALKDGEENDFNVFLEVGKGKEGIYVLDRFKKKLEVPDLEQRLKDFWNKCKKRDSVIFGKLRKVAVEDKASGIGLIQGIKRKAKIPIEGIERTSKSRYERVNDVLGYIESGYVHLPENADWVDDFLNVCEEFTADDTHAFDDDIDPLVDAINDMIVSAEKVTDWSNLL
jgi:predicted phage terminase large subunit-like protein